MKRIAGACYLAGVMLALSAIGCSRPTPKVSAEINESASIVGDLPANPLQWKAITLAVNQSDNTMATLYGNDAAVDYARTHSQNDYPAGAELSLVTWIERDDPRWYGAKMPDAVKSVEFVTVKAAPDGKPIYSYHAFEGMPLRQSSAMEAANPTGRAAFLLSQRAAVMP